MKIKKQFIFLALFLVFFVRRAEGGWQDVSPVRLPLAKTNASDSARPYLEGRILVKYNRNIVNLDTTGGKSRKNNFESRHHVRESKKLTDAVFLYDIKDSATVDEKIKDLKKDASIEIAQPDYLYKITAITPPNDPGWPSLWGLNNSGQTINSIAGTSGDDIQWLYAWDKYMTDANSGKGPVVVADIDTGFDYTHPDVDNNNLWDGSACKDEYGNYLGGCLYGYDYDYDKKDPMTAGMNTHGTCTGGIVAAAINNGVGITGINPDVKLMSIKADMQSVGEPGTFATSTLIKAIKFATQNGAKIINMSLGGEDSDNPLLTNAIGNFPGLVVAAAGNDSADNNLVPVYPCNLNAILPNVICVGATDQNDILATFSNYGTNSVDLVAPGNNIEVLYYDPINGSYYALGGGTSFSAPYVSGLASLLMSYQSSLTATQVKSAILNNGDVKTNLNMIRQIDNGVDSGGRRLNAYKAILSIDPLTAILSGTPPATTNSTSLQVNVSGTGITNYQYFLDADAYDVIFSTGTQISVSGLSIGAHTLHVMGIDSLGNRQSQAGATTYSWNIISSDITAPDPPRGLSVL